MVEDKKEDYLEQLKEIERRDKFRKARKIYKKYKEKGGYNLPVLMKAKSLLKDKKIDHIKTAAFAYELMQKGIERGDVQYSLFGAQLYEKIGRGRKAIPRLLKGIERNISVYGSVKVKVFPEIRTFIKKNAGERAQGKGSLEKKFGIFIAFIIGGIALSLGSLTLTGNAVSNLTQTTPGLLGIIFFIAGLVGVFCSRGK